MYKIYNKSYIKMKEVCEMEEENAEEKKVDLP